MESLISRRSVLLLFAFIPASWASAGHVYEQRFDNATDQAPIGNVGWKFAASDGGGSDTGLRQFGRLSNAKGVGGEPGFAYNWNGTGGHRAIVTWYDGPALQGGIPRDRLEAFSLWIGHGDAGVESRFLVEIENEGWFVTTEHWSMAPITVSEFEAKSEAVTFAFTSAGAAWRALAFDGGVGSASAGFAVFNGTQGGLAGDLPAGNIVSVGMYHYNPHNVASRYDDFRVMWAAAADDDARLLAVLGRTDAEPGTEAGTAEEPITWSLIVPMEEEAVALADVAVPAGAAKRLFASPGFTENEVRGEETITLEGDETTVYIQVTATDATTTLHYSVTLRRVPLYAVSYFANGGAGNVPVDPESPYPENALVTVMAAGGLFRTGHVFDRWNTAADGSGISLVLGELFLMPGTDVHLHAQWIELVSGNVLVKAARPVAWIYDAVGDGQRDGRPPLPFPDDLPLTIELQRADSGGAGAQWDLWATRHTLGGPLRVMVQASDDLKAWRTLAILPPPSDPSEEGMPLDEPLHASGSPLFARGAVTDARVLHELTPDSARNFWARFMAGCLTVMNSGGTMGNGTRGADTQGRVFGTGDYELVLRTLWSLGSWFYHPGRPATLDWTNPLDGSSGTVDLAAFALNAMRNGPDPAHPQNWPQTFDNSHLGAMQPSVEAANLAWTAWALQRGAAAGDADSPWNALSAADRANLQNWLSIHGSVPNTATVNHDTIYNWNLFFVLNQEARKRLNAAGYGEFSWTQSQIDNGRAAVDDLHRGSGWYSDFGPFDIFDDYIPWTFATHLLLHAHMGATESDAATRIPGRPEERTRAAILSELREFLSLTPYYYDLEGGNPEFGRSTTYKVARLAGLLIAYAVDGLAATEAPDTWTQNAFPKNLSPGQLRRLVRLHLNHYLRNETFHWPSGLQREGLTPDTAQSLIESYSVRGSTYWAMILFTGLWLIPDNDPFWTEPEETIPAQDTDFGLWLETPQWFFSHLRERGDLRKYVLRSAYRTESWAENSYHPKYAKFAYSSRFGHLLSGATRGDQMIRIGNRERRLSEAGDVWPMVNATPESPMVLRTVHTQGSWRISTLIFLRGMLDVRVHRISGPAGTETIADGGFPLGHTSGETLPAPRTGPDWMYLESSRGAMLQASLLGFSGVNSASGTGNHSRDPAWRRMWAEAPGASLPGTFASLQVAAAAPFDPQSLRAQVSEVTHDTHSATVRFADGTEWTVPFLP
ncbi:MAG: DUF2264 domain-containing protein [Opitutales bacterium]|nr:DUF2264 domain-containing protein [Opitutales bacterium]